MLSSNVLPIFLFVGLASAAAGDQDYVYHFKVTEFYARVLSEAVRGLTCAVQQETQRMEQHCRFNKTMGNYELLIERTRLFGLEGFCSTSRHSRTLRDIKDKFKSSRDDCIRKSESDCKNNLADITADIIQSVQSIDEAASRQLSLSDCKSDQACRKKVYQDIHTKLFQLYADKQPALRVAADQALTQSKCAAAIVTCMVDKNSANLSKLYKGIAILEDCISGAGKNSGLTNGGKQPSNSSGGKQPSNSSGGKQFSNSSGGKQPSHSSHTGGSKEKIQGKTSDVSSAKGLEEKNQDQKEEVNNPQSQVDTETQAGEESQEFDKA